MITFTIPNELRDTAWGNQKMFYNLMFECSKMTLQTFARNDKSLGGATGLMSVLHTHARNLDYHPHIHIIMPAATLNNKTKSWKTKSGKYLFNHKALAKVFRGKLLENMAQTQLKAPIISHQWIVDCKYIEKEIKPLSILASTFIEG